MPADAELAARAIIESDRHGVEQLRELLLELTECWPATAELQLRSNGDLAAGVQLCPPARALLLRLGNATIAALGL